MRNPLARAKYCPRCSNEMVEWVTWACRDGYDEEQKWFGCPVFRDRATPRHYEHPAHWRSGERRSLFNPKTGEANAQR